MAPKQKALVVDLVKVPSRARAALRPDALTPAQSSTTAVTLAIGDGANDVSMIQARGPLLPRARAPA